MQVSEALRAQRPVCGDIAGDRLIAGQRFPTVSGLGPGEVEADALAIGLHISEAEPAQWQISA